MPERVTIIGAGGEAREAAVLEHRLAAVKGREAFDGEGTELACYAALADFLKGIAADEITLAESDSETQSGLIRIVVRGYVTRPIEVALFHAAAVNGAVAGVCDA